MRVKVLVRGPEAVSWRGPSEPVPFRSEPTWEELELASPRFNVDEGDLYVKDVDRVALIVPKGEWLRVSTEPLESDGD